MPPFHLKPEAVAIGAAADRGAAIAQLAALFASAWSLDGGTVRAGMLAREDLGSTGFGRGIALPHTRVAGLATPLAAVLRIDPPVAFGAGDGRPVALLFGLVSPDGNGVAHLHALAALSRLTRDDALAGAMLAASEGPAIHAAIAERIAG